MRRVTIEPGGVFGPVHSHVDRPGAVFILRGRSPTTATAWRQTMGREWAGRGPEHHTLAREQRNDCGRGDLCRYRQAGVNRPDLRHCGRRPTAHASRAARAAAAQRPDPPRPALWAPISRLAAIRRRTAVSRIACAGPAAVAGLSAATGDLAASTGGEHARRLGLAPGLVAGSLGQVHRLTSIVRAMSSAPPSFRHAAR